jgi:hypothetical protein
MTLTDDEIWEVCVPATDEDDGRGGISRDYNQRTFNAVRPVLTALIHKKIQEAVHALGGSHDIPAGPSHE